MKLGGGQGFGLVCLSMLEGSLDPVQNKEETGLQAPKPLGLRDTVGAAQDTKWRIQPCSRTSDTCMPHNPRLKPWKQGASPPRQQSRQAARDSTTCCPH